MQMISFELQYSPLPTMPEAMLIHENEKIKLRKTDNKPKDI